MTNKEFLEKADFLIGRYNYRLASMCKCFGNDGDKTHLYAELIALDNFCEGLEGRTLEIVLMDERKKEIMEQEYGTREKEIMERYKQILWERVTE